MIINVKGIIYSTNLFVILTIWAIATFGPMFVTAIFSTNYNKAPGDAIIEVTGPNYSIK